MRSSRKGSYTRQTSSPHPTKRSLQHKSIASLSLLSSIPSRSAISNIPLSSSSITNLSFRSSPSPSIRTPIVHTPVRNAFYVNITNIPSAISWQELKSMLQSRGINVKNVDKEPDASYRVKLLTKYDQESVVELIHTHPVTNFFPALSTKHATRKLRATKGRNQIPGSSTPVYARLNNLPDHVHWSHVKDAVREITPIWTVDHTANTNSALLKFYSPKDRETFITKANERKTLVLGGVDYNPDIEITTPTQRPIPPGATQRRMTSNQNQDHRNTTAGGGANTTGQFSLSSSFSDSDDDHIRSSAKPFSLHSFQSSHRNQLMDDSDDDYKGSVTPVGFQSQSFLQQQRSKSSQMGSHSHGNMFQSNFLHQHDENDELPFESPSSSSLIPKMPSRQSRDH